MPERASLPFPHLDCKDNKNSRKAPAFFSSIIVHFFGSDKVDERKYLRVHMRVLTYRSTARPDLPPERHRRDGPCVRPRGQIACGRTQGPSLPNVPSSVGFWKTGKNQKNRERGYLSCYEIEHPIDRNRKECQIFSTQNLFTISRQSSAKNARLGALFNPRLMGNRGGKAKFLHIRHGFVHVFSPYLMPFCGFASTPKNKKSTPNFFSALTFWSQRCLFFC